MNRQLRFSIWFPIILVTAFAAGYLFWQKTLVPGPYDLELVSAVKHQTTESLDTSNWKTYRNEEYGFELKYPSNVCNNNEFCKTLDICDYDKTCPNEFVLEIGANDDGPHWALVTLSIKKEAVENFFNELRQDPELQIIKENKENNNNVNWSIIKFKEKAYGKESIVAGTEHLGYGFYLTELTFLGSFKFIEPDSKNGEVCIQVITKARNPQTGEVKDFPTPCDVPEGWQTL